MMFKGLILLPFVLFVKWIICDGSQCGASSCDVNQRCVNITCVCKFGYTKKIGCQRLPGNTLDRIIEINKKAGLLHQLFEGDIDLNPGQQAALHVHKGNWGIVGKRSSLDLTSLPDIPIKYWRLPVPVSFAPRVPSSVKDLFSSLKFFRSVQPSDPDTLFVIQGDGCYSSVGRQGGRQDLSVGVGCEDVPIILHLILHTLGMWHEQNRVDRDDYITLHPENMMDGAQENFHKYHLFHPKDIMPLLSNVSLATTYYGHHLPESLGSNLTTLEGELEQSCLKATFQYDVCSLMHLGPFSYSNNGKPVFSPKAWRKPCSDPKLAWESDFNKFCNVYLYQVLFQYKVPVGCFPPSSTVLLENGERKSIGELMIGESVMVMDEHNHMTFSDVHLMMHKQDDMTVNYFIFESENGQTLTASPEHVVYVASHWSYKPETRFAEKVKVGDYLFRPEISNGTFVPVRVMAVRREDIKGAYAPTTLAGNIIVDGHLASSYVYIENQEVSHGFFLPWRVSYRMYNAVFGKTLHVPAPGLHWSLSWFLQLYCRIIGHDVCETLLKVA